MSNRDDRVDRYVRGELSPAEARELAQESLDDPELFEMLTYSALAKKAVAESGGKVVRFWRPRRLILAGSIAAAVVLASVYALRPARSPAAIGPTLDAALAASQPVLLANDLPGPRQQPEIFRGADADARPPRSAGTIVAVEDGMATIDIGSVDGLAEGVDLEVYRGVALAGHVRVTTVFRERARGSVDGPIRPRDQVRIPGPVQLTARMEQVRTLAARGNLAAARTAAEESVQWAASAGVPAQAQVPAWHMLAVLRLLQKDTNGGETLLERAAAVCPQSDVLYPQILNNLGVVAELKGDKLKAKEQYAHAVRALTGSSSEAQKKVIESNLARVAR